MGLFDSIRNFIRSIGNDVTEEEIISMVNEGHEQGVFKATEAEMIQNIFAFDDKEAKDIMTHRSEIAALNGEITLGEAISVFNENHFSRYPVYLEDLDNIVGIIHMKEMFPYAARVDEYGRKLTDIENIMRKAEFVPETHGISTLFTQMQLEKSHMVIVMDEYGQTSGLVTLEDIIEEIVGNIQDEHDDEKDSIVRDSISAYRMDGKTPLDEVEKTLNISFEENDFETLNGFLTAKLGHIPKEDETVSVEVGEYTFESNDVHDRVIGEVTVRRKDKASIE